MNNLLWIPTIGIIGLLFALVIYKMVMKKDPGNEKMKDIAEQIHIGAMVFLRREYQIIFLFMIVVFVVLTVFLSLYTGIAYLGGQYYQCSQEYLECRQQHEAAEEAVRQQ